MPPAALPKMVTPPAGAVKRELVLRPPDQSPAVPPPGFGTRPLYIAGTGNYPEFMVQVIVRLIAALNGNVKKSQLAAGFAWAFLLGFIPAGNFFWIVLFIASFFFRHNHAAKLLVMLLVKLFNPLAAPLLDMLGWEILNLELLRPWFTSLYNMPFVPFTRFNNTLVAGGLAAGLVLWLPVFFLGFALTGLYRSTLGPVLRKFKVLQLAAKMPFLKQISEALAGAVRGE